MRQAAEGGTLLFWMPEADPMYLTPEMVYGATTRFELGEWMARYEIGPTLSIELCGEDNFPTLHTIKYDMYDLMGDNQIVEQGYSIYNIKE